MAESSPGLFREKSLERLSSPERLDQLLRVVDRRSWIPLLATSILVAGVVVWAVFGRIPVNVQGRGMLGRPRDIVHVETPSAGYLSELDVTVGERVAAGAVVGKIRKPEIEKQLALEREKAKELAAQIRAVKVILNQPPGASTDCSPDVQGTSVEAYILGYRKLAEALRQKEQQAIEEDRARLQEQWNLTHELAESRRKRLEAQRKLQESGIVSVEALVEVEASMVDSLSKMSDVEGKLREVQTRQLEAEERYLDRIERISDREQQFAEVNRKVAMLEDQLREGSQIVAAHAARVIEVSAAVGDFLEAGARIASMVVNESSNPLECVTYFTVKDGKRVALGMPVLVTPDTVERERYGSIVGKVTAVSPFPVSLSEAEEVVGNRELAEALIAGGYRIQVFSELEPDPTTSSAVKWSASKGPGFPITAGTTTTARVVVERRAPITFVIPILKSAAGID
ncbi:MAG: NHLP bacteriocin system secretion protein [Planctomycetes bacterium]|nr:NHLP bacteriocin system secretion protein [Planctomycetota bacterium]MBI3844235.1 NHLP bacteriocin system secretion protein [Planctomycetota bacterium]